MFNYCCFNHIYTTIWSEIYSYHAVTFNSGTDLFWARCDGKSTLSLQSVLKCLFSNADWTTHVFITAISATADQSFIWKSEMKYSNIHRYSSVSFHALVYNKGLWKVFENGKQLYNSNWSMLIIHDIMAYKMVLWQLDHSLNLCKWRS